MKTETSSNSNKLFNIFQHRLGWNYKPKNKIEFIIISSYRIDPMALAKCKDR